MALPDCLHTSARADQVWPRAADAIKRRAQRALHQLGVRPEEQRVVIPRDDDDVDTTQHLAIPAVGWTSALEEVVDFLGTEQGRAPVPGLRAVQPLRALKVALHVALAQVERDRFDARDVTLDRTIVSC